ncbi:hypothetical protein [Kitasatospora sp. NPDC101183]|uniref:hypothetical protein n=1 Tax=Kitasatospora sp. NPDC101183 TaxID=3364100 RepID=UPI00381E43D2
MYGQEPQYPPGGQPPYGAQPPYGPPQPQPPHPPYGAPQPGYGGYPQQQPPYGPPQQPGYPAQPGYGGYPGYPQPPRRSRGGLVAALVVGALVLGGGGFAAWKYLGGGGDDKPGTYKLVAPQTIGNGYDRGLVKEDATDVSKPEMAAYGKNLHTLGVAFDHGSDKTDYIVVAGLYGELNDPGQVLDEARKNAGALTWTTPLTDFPARDDRSSSARLACGAATALGKPGPIVCVWADHSTFGRVSFMAGGTQGLTPVQAAEKTRAIRDLMKVAK